MAYRCCSSQLKARWRKVCFVPRPELSGGPSRRLWPRVLSCSMVGVSGQRGSWVGLRAHWRLERGKEAAPPSRQAEMFSLGSRSCDSPEG